jgi:hypothetical protein
MPTSRSLTSMDGAQVLLRPHHEACDADLARLLHGPLQQGVGLGRSLVGSDVVGGVEEHGVDLDQVDELLDVDRARARGVEGGQLVVVDEHVLARRQLVALDDGLARHLGLVGGRDLLVADAGTGASVDLVEVDALAADCVVELDGDVDQPEADRPAPDGPRHRRGILRDHTTPRSVAHLVSS